MGWSHVQELIAVGDRAERMRLQGLAAKEGWTVRELKAKVQQLHGGKRSQGGRKFALPEATEERLGRLAELGRMWLRLLEEVVLSDRTGVGIRLAEAPSGADLEALRGRLEDVLKILDEVRIEAAKAEEQLRKLEGSIEPPGPDGRTPAPKRKSNGRGP